MKFTEIHMTTYQNASLWMVDNNISGMGWYISNAAQNHPKHLPKSPKKQNPKKQNPKKNKILKKYLKKT